MSDKEDKSDRKVDNQKLVKKNKTLSRAEIEIINRSIIEQLKAQSTTLDSIIIAAGGAAGAGSSK